MKTTRIMGLVMLAALTLTACVDETAQRQYSFNATMEQLRNADNSKVQLVNEEWTYWEYNDSISLVSNASTQTGGYCDLYTGWLVNGGGGDYSDYNGVFISTLTETTDGASRWFVGIHPANYQKHKITYSSGNHGFTAQVYLDPVQHYRHDSSYARQVLPMIAAYDGPAWDASNPEPYRLDFHSLAGLVRLQLVNGTGASTNINKIELQSLDFTAAPTPYDGLTARPLAGLFPVKNLYNFNAHLDPAGSDLSYTLTLSSDEAAATGSLAFDENEIKSFYVVLPAFHGMDSTTAYHLQMTVTTDAGVFQKSFTVNTRRNGITYLRAINITTFEPSPGTGTGNAVLVGNGTATRPFKIYTIEDLRYVRTRFNSPDGSGNVYVNGQPVTANTYFRIMRSDIVLTASNWTLGINNFKGHMTYYSTTPRVTHGIVNQSYAPLFTSISAEGVVKGIAMVTNSDLDFNANGASSDYSPLCGTNYGLIENCRNISPSGLSGDARRFIGTLGGCCYAGICVINQGTITGCDYSAERTFMNNCNFAGICKENNGTIQGCELSAPAVVEGAGNRGGICYTNNGTVKDCYCNITYNDFTNGANWGGIVYQNSTGTTRLVSNCYVSRSAIIRSNGNVGGIVCTNSGKVDYCHNESYALQGKDVGGIVCTQNAGVVSNCYIDDPSLYLTLYAVSVAHSVGGIVGVQNAGTIQNCFANLRHLVVSSTDATGTYGAIVGRIAASAATVNNCYAYEANEATPQFYGSNNGGTLTNCHLVGATQTDVDGITTVNSSSLDDLLGSLNTNKPDGGLSWTRESGDSALPTLVPPTSSKQHRTR